MSNQEVLQYICYLGEASKLSAKLINNLILEVTELQERCTQLESLIKPQEPQQ